MIKTGFAGLAAIGMLLLSATFALAHHPMGGALPQTFWHGLLSGIGHPVIGIDHLAFVIAAGIAAALAGPRVRLAAVFIAATVAGCLLTAAGGVTLPLTEVVIAASVLLVGGLLMAGTTVPVSVFTVLFAVAGLYHGSAYAGAIVGAEATPLLAYLIGFGLVQFAIMVAAGWAAGRARAHVDGAALEPRLAGAVVAGVGLTFLVEHAERIMFPGM